MTEFAEYLTDEELEAEQNEYAYPESVGWVRLDCNWYKNVKLEEAAETAGPIVLALFPVALALAGQRGPYSAARVAIGDLARILHADEDEVLRAVDACIDAGVFETRRQHSDELVNVAVAIGNPYRPTVTPAMRVAVLERDGRNCGICGEAIGDTEEMHIDHIKPLARGGSNDLDNLQPAHGLCNRIKGARL